MFGARRKADKRFWIAAYQYGCQMNTKERKELRTAIADYMKSEGCSCCRDTQAHKEAEARIAKILLVPKYQDGSGYDFSKFETKDAE